MTEASTDGIFNLTTPVIMSFPQLLEPKAFMENGKAKGDPKYSCNLNFAADSADLLALKTKAAKLARAKWPDKPFVLTTQEGVKIHQVIFPFTAGDKLIEDRKQKLAAQNKSYNGDADYMAGKVVLASRSKYEPRLSYIENGKIIDLEGDVAKHAAKGKFYPGVEVLAQINLVPYDGVGANGKPGVTAYLNMVLSTGKGARISGGQTASEAFKGYVGAVSAENPMGPGASASMSDSIDF